MKTKAPTAETQDKPKVILEAVDILCIRCDNEEDKRIEVSSNLEGDLIFDDYVQGTNML